MESDKKIILVGYSGHSFALLDIAIELGYSIVGYSENKIKSNNPYNLTYLGDEGSDDFKGWKMSNNYIIGIGDNKIREKALKFIKKNNKKIISIIWKTSSISKTAIIGNGTFINRNVAINSLSSVGENCILNTGCIIEHECKIGSSCHVGPGAVITGNVNIGDRTFIGANAVIKPGLKIGNDVVIGAGTVVLRDIENQQKLVGNPARILWKIKL